MLISSIFTTPLGYIEVVHNEHYIFTSSFTQNSGDYVRSELGELIAEQLSSYFSRSQHRFQLPLKPQGSIYQQKVWNALLVIPVGRTLTYGELALKLQSSARAIGQACKKNPLALFIPCHRVVAKNNIGGYMGNPLSIHYKQALLEHETDCTT